MTLHTPGPVRRAFTETELNDILARADAAGSTSGLLTAVVGAVYDTLLADSGLSLKTLPDGQRVDPRRFQIPTVQWQAICDAVTDRAAAWGTAAELAMELVALLPDSYDDPAAATPQRPHVDRRPPQLRLAVSRDAVDVIAAATRHVQALAAYYGPASEEYLNAAGSWLSGLSRLLSLDLGADTRVYRDGPLSLVVTTGSGLTYGLTFHGTTRRCTTGDGCTATIADDGTLHASGPAPVPAAHNHQPSFPLDAPQPGTWSAHS